MGSRFALRTGYGLTSLCAQSPYIWSYALNGWIYMVELVADAPGAWGFFYK